MPFLSLSNDCALMHLFSYTQPWGGQVKIACDSKNDFLHEANRIGKSLCTTRVEFSCRSNERRQQLVPEFDSCNDIIYCTNSFLYEANICFCPFRSFSYSISRHTHKKSRLQHKSWELLLSHSFFPPAISIENCSILNVINFIVSPSERGQ